MGQTPSSRGGIKAHLETASKTGALVLNDKKLNELPDFSGVETLLRTLDISSNKFTHLSNQICQISNLKHITANNNKLITLPEDIGSLKKLESLSLMHNCLSSLPESCNKLKNLKSLILSHNNLSEFPSVACCLPHLDVLDVSNNKIESIPDSVQDLQAVELNLNMNQVSSISSLISKCQRLKTLRLEENCLLLQSLPDSLLQESNVSLLCLQGNAFNMKELQELDGYNMYMERYTAVKKKMF